MKVIELLTKIANGEESDTITEFEFNKSIWNFFKLQNSEYCVDKWLLNQEIVITKHKEIIEEPKKIEKLETYDIAGNIFLEDCCFKYIPIDKEKLTANEQVFVDKINEIIDYIMEEK